MPQTAQQLVDEISDRISIPDTIQRVNTMVNNPNFSAADIGDTLKRNQPLSARLLRITNSALFDFPSHINSVHRAITIIGNQELRDLLLAICAIDLFNELPNKLISMDTFWRHSLRCGLIARSVASHLRKPYVERYFTAGLLHDIGSLLINAQRPETAQEILSKSNKHRQRRFVIEKELLGFSHAEVGAELLKRWNLPRYLIEAVEHHHTPDLATAFPVDAAISHIANYLSTTTLSNIGENIEASDLFNIKALKTTGLSPDELQHILYDSDLLFDDTLKVIVYNQVA